MPSSSFRVINSVRDRSKIPEALGRRALILAGIARSGALQAVGEQLHISRQGGYAGIDVFCTLALLFSDGASKGVRTLWDSLRRHRLEVGALAGRKSLPSPAALSTMFSPFTAYVFLVFTLLYPPCVAAIGAVVVLMLGFALPTVGSAQPIPHATTASPTATGTARSASPSPTESDTDVNPSDEPTDENK